MREIKFRGKVDFNIEELSIGELSIEHDNGWVYGNLIADGDVVFIVGGIADWDSEYLAHDWWIMADPDTVGQYIGLKDKNGKEIYEGDILHCWGGEYCQGYWEFDTKFAIKNLINDCFMLGESEFIEVIGNKWDNPELLKE